MASHLKIIDVTRVTLTAPSPAPEPLKLSALDAMWITLPLIQRVLFFDDDGGRLPHFPSLLHSLRSSLAATLSRFLPLAGKIVLLASGDAALDCAPSGGSGVRFVAAEYGADARCLSGDAAHDVEAFGRLVPGLDADVLPAEVLAVQVTRLDGGVALGVAIHHAAADGLSVWRFLEAWAAACRGEAQAAAAAPTFDRAVIALPGGDNLARSVLRTYAPHLPVATVPQFLVEGRMQLSRRTFTVSGQHIHRLKQHIAGHLGEAQGAPSTFVSIAALAWTSFVRCKPVAPDGDDVYLFFFADCRARLDPPVDAAYFGTCISGCLAKASAKDLLAEDGITAAAAAVQREVQRAAEEPLAGWDWMDMVWKMPIDRLVNISGSPRFPAYEAADFGWGGPSRTELVSMNHAGQVVLVGAKGGDGVQASVALQPAHMDAFTESFLEYSLQG